MIIEIESVCGDVMIIGKSFLETELREAVKELLLLVSESDFKQAFCLRYGYTQIDYDSSVSVDYIIDLDAHTVVKPKY